MAHLFSRKKATILAQLNVSPADYQDLSPKGSVDEGIRELIDEINAIDGLVTTSSCAGRASVFLEGSRRRAEGKETVVETNKEADDVGRKSMAEEVEADGDDVRASSTVAAAGGKGGGGTWLYVSHDPFPVTAADAVRAPTSWATQWKLNMTSEEEEELAETDDELRYVHFKFEPMILHIYTASPGHAQRLLKCAFQAGFRESGAQNIAPPGTSTSATQKPVTPMVAVRSMGLGLEALVAEQSCGRRTAMVTDSYLQSLVGLSNQRFAENTRRIARFREALLHEFVTAQSAEATPKFGKKTDREDRVWEDAESRRKRKMEEGLRRREMLRQRGDDNDGRTLQDRGNGIQEADMDASTLAL